MSKSNVVILVLILVTVLPLVTIQIVENPYYFINEVFSVLFKVIMGIFLIFGGLFIGVKIQEWFFNR